MRTRSPADPIIGSRDAVAEAIADGLFAREAVLQNRIIKNVLSVAPFNAPHEPYAPQKYLDRFPNFKQRAAFIMSM